MPEWVYTLRDMSGYVNPREAQKSLPGAPHVGKLRAKERRMDKRNYRIGPSMAQLDAALKPENKLKRSQFGKIPWLMRRKPNSV